MSELPNNTRMNGQVPGWIQEDMIKHLPPPNAVQGDGNFCSPHDRPTTFQTRYSQPSNNVLGPRSPWGSQVNRSIDPRAGHPSMNTYIGMGAVTNTTTPWNYGPHVSSYDDGKKKRRVRKRPKKKVSSYHTYETSSRSSQDKSGIVMERAGSIPHDSVSLSFGDKIRVVDDDSFCREEHHDEYAQHAYRGPNFIPDYGASSSDWGVVPPKELKWNRRKGSYDLFPDWQNSSHHAKKYVQRRKGCC